MIYTTSYCNKGHNLVDGKPVNHECHVLPPEALAAERAGNVLAATRIIQEAKPLRLIRQGVRA